MSRERMTLDLRRLAFIDSSGMSVLIGADAEDRRTGTQLTILVADGGIVKRALDVTGLSGRLPIQSEP
jgi:anti-anti-sigma factor